jgi:N-acetylneuraminic acid mutarotase
MDMWTFDIDIDIEEENWNWSPVSFKSSIKPSPRSDFAHARYLDNFIIFGGRRGTELLNDIYRYNTKAREWKEIISNSAEMPTARRAACMAASDDFIVIFGGIEASGYSNELWRFEWGTQTFTLLGSYSPPPKTAFSQCHIENNGKVIFKAYGVEKEGEEPFIYEYNFETDRWTHPDFNKNTKYIQGNRSPLFMLNDSIISAGGFL